MIITSKVSFSGNEEYYSQRNNIKYMGNKQV